MWIETHIERESDKYSASLESQLSIIFLNVSHCYFQSSSLIRFLTYLSNQKKRKWNKIYFGLWECLIKICLICLASGKVSERDCEPDQLLTVISNHRSNENKYKLANGVTLWLITFLTHPSCLDRNRSWKPSWKQTLRRKIKRNFLNRFRLICEDY